MFTSILVHCSLFPVPCSRQLPRSLLSDQLSAYALRARDRVQSSALSDQLSVISYK
ncbi:hypothetical protein BJP36_38770 [Moorena producens JHB]|uniref:Uncharacterized protein n=1 Tax=Moorena producens (strain JHB) TaxID=1454205 RepID=A0A9Q9SUP3_MOOP1|nr:hypothetical protein [Moorena producens]WAN70016.1 hypothetical protein BJP36_38770 [Moorena producens JHB]